MRSEAAAERPRVVLDTNVLVSALGLRGRIARIERLLMAEACPFFTSEFILGEFARVMIEKIRIPPVQVAIVAGRIRAHSTLVEPNEIVRIIKADDSDNRILECGLAASADVIVTGDLKHLRPIEIFRGIRLLTPGEFLTRYFPVKNA